MVIEVRSLQASDMPAAMRLKDLAQWNQTENDWQRLLSLEPNGCFCATIDGDIVGTTTTTTYGPRLAWVGMVLVDPQYRRTGIATRLMEVAREYLVNAGVQTIKLDATPAGRAVYERLGFKEESMIERWQGTARISPTDPLSMNGTMRNEAQTLDVHAFGVDRLKLIKVLIEDSCVVPPIAMGKDDRLSGYALARTGTSAVYLGPVLATESASASTLLDRVMNQIAGESVYIDLNANFEDGRSILIERGFVKQRDLVRMSLGVETKAGLAPSIFAIAGPEVG